MTGRKSTKNAKKRLVAQQQQAPSLQPQQPPQQPQQQPRESQSQTPIDDLGSPPVNIKREQPPPTQIVKKILKAENDEAKTLKVVFKSNPDTQMKEFIKKAAVKPPNQQVAAKTLIKTPADAHPPAVAQELLDTDDDVADNLAKLFKTSKSYKNL